MSYVTHVLTCFFFFSSRRRHTRSKRDWSSDVCSSDLSAPATSSRCPPGMACTGRSFHACRSRRCARSEERRVGKEGRSWVASGQEKEKVRIYFYARKATLIHTTR